MTRDELVNRILDAEPTDQIVIKIGDICNRDVKIKDVSFIQRKEKMVVKIPEVVINYLD